MPFRPAFSEANNDSKIIGTSSTQILSKNPDRVYALIVNDSQEPIYLGLAVDAVMNKGIRLNPNGGSFEITLGNPFLGKVTGICANGNMNVTYVEK